MSRRSDFSWWTVLRRVVDVSLLGAAAASAAMLYVRAEELDSESRLLRNENRRLRQQQDVQGEPKMAASPQPVCITCMDAEIETVLLPCGHACLCRNCAQVVRDKCPMCRRYVERVQTIFLTTTH